MGKARAAGCISAVATSHTQRRALSRFGPTFRREVRPAKPRVLEAKAAANSCRRLASRSNGQRQPCGRTAAASARERPAATGRARRTGRFERGARPRRRATGGDEHATTIQPRRKIALRSAPNKTTARRDDSCRRRPLSSSDQCQLATLAAARQRSTQTSGTRHSGFGGSA